MTIPINLRLRQLRTDAELSQMELAEWLGIANNAVSQLECGRYEGVRLETLRRYCRVFRMSLSELLEGVQ